MPNREQTRAQYAYAAAENIDGDIAKKLPMLLRTNGLLATWAFLMAKGKKDGKYSEIAQELNNYLDSQMRELCEGTPEDSFKRWIGNQNNQNQRPLNGTQLRDLTEEAIEYAGWLKRAVEAKGE